MPTTKGTQAPSDELPKSANADQSSSSQVSAEPSKRGPEFAASRSGHEPEHREIRWWRVWLQRFLAEFHLSAPQKQVEQIYQITATLAVIGSVLAGLWATYGYFWPEKPETTETTISAKVKPAPKLSIVVLPFANLSGDAGQEYFADGITDSLITDLSRALPGNFVVARATAFTYRGKATDARQIGRDLNVRYALEGSVLLDGEQIRINARLVDTQAGNEIWGDRFDTPRGDLLKVQDEIVGRLSRAIGLQVISFAAQHSERVKASNVDAIDLVLRGQAALNRPSSMKTMIEARDLFERALKLQSDNVDALAGVATTYIFEVLNGYYSSGNEERLQRAEPVLARILTLDDHHLLALKANAALLRARGKFDEAIAAAQLVIALNPGEPWAYKEVGLSIMYLGRTVDALEWFDKAELFGPRDPGRWTWLGGKGQTLLLLGRDAEAITSLRAAIDSNPADVGDYAVLAAAYALSGHNDEARAALVQYDQARPGTTVETFRNLSPVPLLLTDPSYRHQRERLKDGLRKAGMPE